LIAASTYYVSHDSSLEVIDKFYEQSVSLLEFLKENVEKRVGIITKTVEDQAVVTLRNVIERQLGEKGIDRRTDFEIYSVIQNACETRLNTILRSYLLREPVDEESVHSNYSFVDKMYQELEEEAVLRTVEFRARKWTELAARRFRPLAARIYKEQQQREDRQLINLIREEVEPSDKRILSEAIYLRMLYDRSETEPVTFYMASTDHHFSPCRSPGGLESRQITDRIEKKFEIICDWPQQIRQLAQRTLSQRFKHIY